MLGPDMGGYLPVRREVSYPYSQQLLAGLLSAKRRSRNTKACGIAAAYPPTWVAPPAVVSKYTDEPDAHHRLANWRP